MDQRDRQLEGKLFDAHSAELMSMKMRAHDLCREYNTLSDDDPRRNDIIAMLLGEKGERVGFAGNIMFNYGINTHIGSDFFANFGLTVLDDGPVTIGDHVMIGPNVSIMCSTHPLIPEERENLLYPDGHRGMSEYAPPIRIGNHVWIACGAIITPGVTIGDGSVIGAGSVVTKDMPAGWLCCGVPCRPMHPITEKDSKLTLV